MGAVALLGVSAGSAPAGSSDGFFALSGPAAASYTIPADAQLMRALDVGGLRYERYQQLFGDARAQVLGGQITVYRNGTGTIVSAVGAHYPNITPTNSVSISRAEAASRAERDGGPGAERFVDLLINPQTGRYFFQVETRSLDKRLIHWIDAENGAIVNRIDALENDHGIGVKGDSKSMSGITTFHSSSGHGASSAHYDLFSTDNRQKTYDTHNGTSLVYYVTDSDNHWTTAGRTSPGQPALVDAQFYANVTDDFFKSGPIGLNWTSCYAAGMQSVGHYSRNYNNAFWNGTYTVYGDGDGVSFREFSGGLDVVAHEHTHGVTDCTSALLYQDESGALNESFSDMMGNSAEFFAGESPDWLIAEDISLSPDTAAGFRNMGDPQEDDDPDHYSERQIGGGDNGGVHTNSGISNHAYYLLVNGGKNKGCTGSASGHTHTANCDVTVPALGLAKAETIFFLGFTALPANATFCNARASTIAQASAADAGAVASAWEAVGVTSALCGGGGGGNTAPTADNATATAIAGQSTPITLTGHDAETCELGFSTTSPSKGTLGSLTSPGNNCSSGTPNSDTATVTYTANANASGSDSFTYTVTDGGGLTATATVSITINPAPASGMHVGDLDSASVNNGRTWTPRVVITVHDPAHSPVQSATVTGTWSTGASGSQICATNASGTCSITDDQSFPKKVGSVTFTVTNVTHASLTYAAADNHDPDGDSNGTAINVAKA